MSTTMNGVDIVKIHTAWIHASRDLDNAKRFGKSPHLSALRTNLESARVAWELAMRCQRKELASVRGWTVSKHFTLQQLKDGNMRRASQRTTRERSWPVLDHLEYFKEGRRPAGLLTHTYRSWLECIAFAQNHGLIVERLETSWYSPSQCVAALFTRGAS